LEVGLIDEEKRALIRGEWENRGATLSDLSTFDSEFACTEKWFGVFDNGKTEAIFNVRQAPNYLKNMRVIFAPDIRIDEEGGDYEEAKPIVLRMVDILAKIFSYHLMDLKDGNNDYFKIYSDHREVRLIFYEFCRYIENQFPEKYKLKFYGKWIEIHARN